MMLKIKRLIALLLLSLFFLTGCYNYRDINRTLFVTALILDVDEEDNIVMFVETFHSFRSNKNNTEQGQRIIFQDKGNTIFEVARKLNTASRYKLDYTQCKVYIFTERAAKRGLDDYLDFLRRDQEFLLRAFVAIFYGTPEELLTAEFKQDEFVGIYLYELFQDRLLSSILVDYRFSDFLNTRILGKHINKINAIAVEKGDIDTYIRVEGVALLKNDIMVGLLSPEETVYCNFLYDKIQSGAITIEHPQHIDRNLTLEIRKSKTKSDLHFDGRRILMNKKIDVDVVIADAQKGLVWDRETLRKIEHLGAVKIKYETEAVFNKLKEQGIDVLDIQHDVEIKYPGSDIENAISITELTVDVDVHIKGSTYIRGSKRRR